MIKFYDRGGRAAWGSREGTGTTIRGRKRCPTLTLLRLINSHVHYPSFSSVSSGQSKHQANHRFCVHLTCQRILSRCKHVNSTKSVTLNTNERRALNRHLTNTIKEGPQSNSL